MDEREKKFTKYKSKGADYHWKQINKKDFFHFNPYGLGLYEIISNRILRLMEGDPKSPEHLRIIDFGCGDGALLFILKNELEMAGKKVSVFGADSSPESIATAQEKIPDGIFKCNSVYNVDFQNDFFDIAVSSDVIEHLNNPDKMINEIIRVTKKLGIIAIGTPIKFSETPSDSMHFQEFFPDEFSDLFREKNLETIDHIQSHPLLFTLLYGRTVNLLIKKMKIFKYLINFFAGYFNKNVFKRTRQDKKDGLMSYQSIFLKKQ